MQHRDHQVGDDEEAQSQGAETVSCWEEGEARVS